MRKLHFIPLLLLFVFANTLLAQKKRNKKEKFHYLSNCKTIEEIGKMPTQLEKAYYLNIGEFNNKAQTDTATNPLLKGQEIITVPIWQKQRVGEYWAFTTWFALGNVKKPTVQFVSKFSKKDRDTMVLETFGVPDSMKGALWAQPNPFAKFKPADLIKINCVHYVVQEADGAWKTFLPPHCKPCLSSLSVKGQETYYELETRTDKNLIISKPTFYDKEGKPLMSYRAFPVYYERGDVKNPKYKDILNPKK